MPDSVAPRSSPLITACFYTRLPLWGCISHAALVLQGSCSLRPTCTTSWPRPKALGVFPHQRWWQLASSPARARPVARSEQPISLTIACHAVSKVQQCAEPSPYAHQVIDVLFEQAAAAWRNARKDIRLTHGLHSASKRSSADSIRVQAAYNLAEVLMLHDQRNMTAGISMLMDLHYARDMLPVNGFNLLPPHSSRHDLMTWAMSVP